MPLLIAQSNRNNAAWINKAPLNDRLGQILPQFVLGTGSHAYTALMWIGFGSAAAALVLLARFASSTERSRAAVAGALGLGGFALVMFLAAVATDTVLTRNLLALWLPVAIVIAAGLSTPRARGLGLGLTTALCTIGLTATLSVATDRSLQRPDWAAVARALGSWPSAAGNRADNRLLVFQRNLWLESLTQVYMPRTHKLGDRRARRITEIDIVANSSPRGANQHWLCWWGAGCNLYPSRLQSRYALAGFRVASRTEVRQFTIVRLISSEPRNVPRAELHRGITSAHFFGLLIQRPGAG